MKNKNLVEAAYNSVISYLALLILLLILVTFNKDYPRYFFYTIIGIRVVLFIKSKIEAKFKQEKTVL